MHLLWRQLQRNVFQTFKRAAIGFGLVQLTGYFMLVSIFAFSFGLFANLAHYDALVGPAVITGSSILGLALITMLLTSNIFGQK